MPAVLVCLIIACFLSTACSSKRYAPIVYQQCKNAFVLSDGNRIQVYEQNNQETTAQWLGEYPVKNNSDAFIDCDRQLLVSTYSTRIGSPINDAGVRLIDLTTGKSNTYEIKEDINSQRGRYQNGILITTKRVQHRRVDPDKGYIPFRSLFSADMVLSENSFYPEEVVNDYKNGHRWYRFLYMHHFDLDKRKVIKRYKLSGTLGANIFNNQLFSVREGSVFSLNLTTEVRKKIIEFRDIPDKNAWRLDRPGNALSFFIRDRLYLASTQRSWDYSPNRGRRELRYFDKNTLYTVENEQLIKHVSIPLETIGCLLPVNDDIFVFNTSATQVVQIQPNKQIKTYALNLPIQDFGLRSIGHSDTHFIITVLKETQDRQIRKMLLIKKDFSKVSPAYAIPAGYPSVRTQEHTHRPYSSCAF